MQNKLFAAAAVLVTLAGTAQAQNTYVTPNPLGGGYTMHTPGAPYPDTYITPNPLGGGYTMHTPGARNPDTYITPNPLGGGYTIHTPQSNPISQYPNGNNPFR